MREGKLYKADLEETGDGVVLRLCKRPEVVGRGATFEEAYEELVGSITLSLGDGEPRITFKGIVPSPAAERGWMSDRWVATVARGECMLEWNTPELFTGGVCGLCGRPRGTRTAVPLVASTGSSGDYCGAWFLWDDRAATHWMKNGYSPVIVSERFLGALTGEERDAFDWRPVVMPARARTRYFECLPRGFEAFRVHKEWEQSWLRCDDCGAGEPHCSPMGITGAFGSSGTLRWVAAATLQREPVAFAVGRACDYVLYWPVTRALRLVKGDGIKGMTLFHAGVIPDEDSDRAPTPLSLAERWGRMRADRPGSDRKLQEQAGGPPEQGSGS